MNDVSGSRHQAELPTLKQREAAGESFIWVVPKSKDGKPYLSFAVQGGDAQDQNLLQFFLNMVEFKMTVQQAVEAANVNSYQMLDSFGTHASEPGRLVVFYARLDRIGRNGALA